MNVTCQNARTLVAPYLDGELAEEQASPLRAHLLDCRGCRELAKEERSLKRWFSEGAGEPVEAPPGFAARLARRAFAGDGGTADFLQPVRPASGESVEALAPFVLKLVAVAASVLFVFSLALQRRSLPSGPELDAHGRPPWERELSGGVPADTPAAPAIRTPTPEAAAETPAGSEAPDDSDPKKKPEARAGDGGTGQ